jgi:RES domain-containing protein
MELWNSATIVALRTTVKLAWAIARAAQALGERLESAVERQAHRREVDIADVLEPLIADVTA